MTKFFPFVALAAASSLVAQHDLYVVNTRSDTVSVLDTRNNVELYQIPVGDAPVSVALSSDGARALVSNFSSPSISVIDTGLQAVIATIPLSGSTSDVKIHPHGAKAYAVQRSASIITIIDMVSATVSGTIVLSQGSLPSNMEFSPDGTRAYVVGENGWLDVLDADADSVLDSVTIGRSFSVEVSPDGARVYAVHDIGNAITVFDTVNAAVATVVSLGPVATTLPFDAALSPDGTELYVSVPNVIRDLGTVTGVLAYNVVLVIDTASLTESGSLGVGIRPSRMVFEPNGTRVFVANSDSDTVAVIDSVSRTVTGTIGAGDAPSGLAILPGAFRPPGCTGSNGSTPELISSSAASGGSAWTFDLQQAPASTNGALALSFAATSPLGPLPIQLSLIGAAPSCALHVDPTILLPLAFDAHGTAQLTISIPNGTTIGTTVLTQALIVDLQAASALPIVVSNGANATVVR